MLLLFKSHVKAHTRTLANGKVVQVAAHEDRRVVKQVSATEKPSYWRILSDADDSGGLSGVRTAVVRLLRSGAHRDEVLSVAYDLGYSESRLDLPLIEGPNGAGIDLNIQSGSVNQSQSTSVGFGSSDRADSAAVRGKGVGVKTPGTVNNDSDASTIGVVGHDRSRPRLPEVRPSKKDKESIDSYASPGKWAAAMYEKGIVPEGWYVHGRAYRQDLETGWAIQQTKDWEVAEQYGSSGSLWLIRPKPGAKVLDLSDANSSDMDVVVDAALKDFQNSTGPIQDIINDIESSLGHYPDKDEFEEAIRSSFAPEDIVNSAEAYDNWGWAGWLAQEMEVDFVHVPDGAVALGVDGIQAVKVPNNTDKTLTKSMPRTLLLIKSNPPESKTSLIKEHKRLVAVLRSPSHEDDLEEADKQEAELEEYEGQSDRRLAKAITRSRADTALKYRLDMIAAQMGPLAARVGFDPEAKARYEALAQERYVIMIAMGEASI